MQGRGQLGKGYHHVMLPPLSWTKKAPCYTGSHITFSPRWRKHGNISDIFSQFQYVRLGYVHYQNYQLSLLHYPTFYESVAYYPYTVRTVIQNQFEKSQENEVYSHKEREREKMMVKRAV